MRDSRISSRLFFLVAIFLTLFALFAYFSYRTLSVLRVNGPIYQKIALNDALRADILPPPMYVIESYLLALQLRNAPDANAISQLIQHGDELRISFETRHEYWEREIDDPQIADVFNKTSYRSAIDFYNLRDQQYVPAIRAGDLELAAKVLQQMGSRYEAHRVAIDVVVKAAEAKNTDLLASAEQRIASALQWLGILALVIVVVVLVMAMLARRAALMLSERVGVASEIAAKVAGGDLTVEPPLISDNDETGKLLRAIGAMTHSLRSLVTRVKQASIELMSTATEFAATSRQQESTVQGFSTSTNEIAAAAKQISATSQELLGTMDGVNSVAAQTADLAEQGRAGLRSLDDTMERLARTSSAMSARLAAIREEASEINGVVTTISKVADQTNLLSINAAIEAEKAGEQGLGFLVLAREIRRLADQTAVATLDIEQMVKQMQAAVSAGVMEIDRFAEEVRTGIGGVERVGGQFVQIVGQVKTLSERFDQVNHGMRSQSHGARQISDAMGQLIDGARQTSVSLREFNSATENLRDAVATLKQQVSQFNVG
jgi:methyl-accepting chemotaxis protein WspA